MKYSYVSKFNSNIKVMIDPWAPSPLVDDYRQASPGTASIADREGPPPTLFRSGDLPAVTASGVAPELLRLVPYTARHALAAEPDRATVARILEEEADNPDFRLDHPGLEDYQRRVSDWASGRARITRNPATAAGDDVYQQLYGGTLPPAA